MKNIEIEINESACKKFSLTISKPKLFVLEQEIIITAFLNTDEKDIPYNVKYRIGIASINRDGEVINLNFTDYFFCHFEVLYMYIRKSAVEEMNDIEKILIYPTNSELSGNGFIEIGTRWD